MRKAAITVKGKWGQQRTKNPATTRFIADNDLTEGSKNYETASEGILKKRKGGLVYNSDDVLSNPFKDQFEAIFSDGVRHLLAVQGGEIQYSTGDRLFNSVVNGTGFVAGANFEFSTIFDRVYGCNGVNAPIVYDKTAVYGTVDYSPNIPRIKNMGAQVPTSPPVASLIVDATLNQVPAGAHTYKVTFLYYDTTESNGSGSSNLVTNDASHTSNNVTLPTGGYGVTARKIYRDNNDGVYRLIVTVNDNTTLSYTDISQIGTSLIPETSNIPPIFGQISHYLDRAWISQIVGEPYLVRHSEATKPDSFPSDNFITCNQNDPITAMVVYLDRLIIFNRQSMGQIVGRTPDIFRYAHIPGSVGCVDNRSIQIRTIRGVPVLIWLSDKGLYAYNGNSIEYISEPIQDLVNLNIQQVVRAKDKNTQTDKSDFQAGTASGGIDLDTLSGAITTKGAINADTSNSSDPLDPTNPKRTWNDQADWELGSTKDSISTIDTGNTLQKPQRTWTGGLNVGTHSGTQFVPGVVGGDPARIELPTIEDHTGASNSVGSSRANLRPLGLGEPQGWGQKFSIAEAGTLNTFTLPDIDITAIIVPPPNIVLEYAIYTDLGGSPQTKRYSQQKTIAYTPFGKPATYHTFSPGIALSPGSYWATVTAVGGTIGPNSHPVKGEGIGTTPSNFEGVKGLSGGVWKSAADLGTNGQIQNGAFTGTRVGSLALTYTFSQTAQSASGYWISPEQDSKSSFINGQMSVTQTLTLNSTISGATTSSITKMQATNDNTNPASWIDVHTVNNLNGTANFTPPSAYRYWRIWIQLNTFDNRNNMTHKGTPWVNDIGFSFPNTATWVSEPIDMSSDISTYDALDIVSSTPANTTLTIEVATSDDNITYTAYGPFGSASVKRYIKIRAIMTDSVNSLSTPTVTSIVLKYTIIANLLSQVIDTGLSGGPVGWDIFQVDFSDNGGSTSYTMRTDDNIGMTSPSAESTVVNGDYPPTALPKEQYVQWRATLTSSADSVPVVESVVINWLITDVPSIRVASLFHDRMYMLAGAEFDEETNNILIVLDENNKFRIWRGVTIATFGFFFNDPYYGDAVEGKLIRFLQGLKDKGVTNIEFDVRSKAFDFSGQDFDARQVKKVVRKLFVTGFNTGASYQFFYSTDGGETFTNFVTDTGATSHTTSSDGKPFEIRLKAQHGDGISYSGRTIMWRILSNDENDVAIESVRLEALVRRGEVSINA